MEQAHEHNIYVYAGTILPFGGSQYDNPLREEARKAVNNWIRTSGVFDAVIDFDLALRDPDYPDLLDPALTAVITCIPMPPGTSAWER